ncbi:MAG: hypothetical protein LWW93_15270 [Hyphomicrobiales bacterium]|nr:hypothetical protein [Hyphomicrobiales bacterium]
MIWSFDFAPFVGPGPFVAIALAAALVAGLGLALRRRGAALRAAALALLVLALAGPELRREGRETLPAVAVLVTDRSASQRLPGRESMTEDARRAMIDRLKALPGVEVREAIVDDRAETAGDGTRLFATLAETLADVPPDRVAGVIALTDGLVHDAPPTAAALGFDAPLHALIAGRPNEIDRRLAVVAAPRFGIVHKKQTLTFRVDDEGVPTPRPPALVTLKRDGVEIDRRRVSPDAPFSFEVEAPHAGEILFEAGVEPLPGDLTPLDDRAVVSLRGVRENLRVLLVSGEPHPGERAWRNLLKSDASVDLVHFTILRQPEKQDLVPVGELSLIAFPTRELFQERLDDFDLIVFDRYRKRGLLTFEYFRNVVDRVKRGGAVLVASGPDYADPEGLTETPLAEILPGTPAGAPLEEIFRPRPTTLGLRHPVTRDLADGGANPTWGRWLRLSPVAAAPDATTLLAGPDDRPLLLLARAGKGRVGLLASDQIWLWARGFDGGGPHGPLLRRLAHWLMQEPDLEEETLRLSSDGRALTVERRTLADRAGPVTLVDPTGGERRLDLARVEPGLWRTTVPADVRGLWRAADGALTALTHVGPADPLEFAELRSNETRLAPIAAATGGSVRRLAGTAGEALPLPRVVLRDGGGMSGAGWIGLRPSRAVVATGAESIALAAGLAAAALLIALLAAVWWREGR